MSCDHGMCPICEQEQAERDHIAEMDAMMESWNWNMTPAECADEMIRGDMDASEVYEAMRRFGFPEGQIGAVEDAYEIFS